MEITVIFIIFYVLDNVKTVRLCNMTINPSVFLLKNHYVRIYV